MEPMQVGTEGVRMVRNIWIAVLGLLCGSGVALAQLPMPGLYPGYPTPPYGPPAPMGPAMPMVPNPGPPNPPWGPAPYGMPMAQPGMMPYGLPLPNPIPYDPRQPVGMPVYGGAGPMTGSAEPYIVGSEKNPALPGLKAPPAKLPPAPVESAAAPCDPNILPAAAMPGPPAEPYTLYEGPRYLSEVKQDNVCVFGQVSYIHWWTSHEHTPPLLTTGNPASVNPGSLANSDTTVLLGGGPIDPHEFSGVQANFGVWLDPDRLLSLEFGGFFLGNNGRQYSYASNANGSPVIAQPVLLPNAAGTGYSETAFTISSPGQLAGSASVSTMMNMMGTELNLGRNLFRLNGWSVDSLFGVRYMYLNDTLTSTQNSTVLPGFPGAISFLGAQQPVGSNFILNDSFNLTNRFYGGQIGGRVDWTSCYGFDIGATFKIAFGATTHTAIIDGSTTLNVNGTSTTAPGGAYALPSSIGTHNSADFSAVPELNLTIGYQILPNVRLTAGYNLIYWPQVERAGEQIDRTQDIGQSPTSTAYTGVAGTHPLYLNARSDFWAQGLNLGVEFKY